MRLFSSKEIKAKKNDSLAISAKRGLEVIKELDKNLKKLESIKSEVIDLNAQYEKDKTEIETKRQGLVREIENLEARRATEMIPINELKIDLVKQQKELEKREDLLEEKEVEFDNKAEQLEDQIDLVGGRWGEVKEEETRVNLKLNSLKKEELRILNKNKEVTKAILHLNEEHVRISKEHTKKASEIALEKAEVLARDKVLQKRNKELEKEESRLKLLEARLARHAKALRGF